MIIVILLNERIESIRINKSNIHINLHAHGCTFTY